MTSVTHGHGSLIATLSDSVDQVAEDALQRCEAAMPHLPVLPGRVRDLGLDAIRFGFRALLEVAASGDRPTAHHESWMLEYHRNAASRGIPLDVQLEIARRVTAFGIGCYWESVRPEQTDAMLTLAARTAPFHTRVEQLIVTAYCRQLGSESAGERLRKAYADALLSGEPPPPQNGVPLPRATAYVVIVLPADGGPPPPLPPLAADDRLLHTVRDGADVVLVPRGPGGSTIVDEVEALARAAGRGAAAAEDAESPAAVPAAYAQACQLLTLRPTLRRVSGLITAADALPELLLTTSAERAGRLADLIDAIAAAPDLVATLSAFLECDLDRTTTAARLFIHRRTLTHRFTRIRDLTGYDPRTSRGVQVLGLALAAWQLRGPAGGSRAAV